MHWANTRLIGLGYSNLASRKLGTEKAFREKSKTDPVGTIFTKCCDYLNIPMS
ncbi:hypothetical protein H8356DRAFT_1335881 [Neocallimastix lanati (nom. inval.)]|nr:hypothetical protein H8356DRAFT_1335881 [Neocallimastix sp. JGI-2020a]